MKFTEALQKCYENPGKIYYTKSKSEEELRMRYYESVIQFNTIGVGWRNDYICESDFETDWQPFIPFVSYEAALIAWLEKNKKIKCVLPDDRVNEYIRKETVIHPSNNDIVHFRTLAKYGKWYILED